jgi:hypothetical protein
VSALYREFTLRSPHEAGAMLSFVKSNAAAFAEKGTPLRVIVTEDEMDRLDEQIRYYFGVVIKAMAEQIWLEGRQFTKDAWHELMARKFLPAKEVLMPDGEIVLKRASIARGQIGVKAMAKFTQEVESYAASEHGVEFE